MAEGGGVAMPAMATGFRLMLPEDWGKSVSDVVSEGKKAEMRSLQVLVLWITGRRGETSRT